MTNACGAAAKSGAAACTACMVSKWAAALQPAGCASSDADPFCRTGKPAPAINHDASEKAAKLAQKLGQLQPFVAVFLQECTGQLASFGPT
jgi:hypothetical protein